MGKQIKIAFVQRNPDCALGSMYIASTVKQEAQCRVFIEAYEEDLCSAIQAYEPDIVAFSTFTGEYKDLLAINSEIKKRIDTLSIFGGPHPTYNPDFINEEGVDVICRGEGEYAVLDLVKALKNDEDYFHIKNLHFKTRNGEVLQNEVRHLIGTLTCWNFLIVVYIRNISMLRALKIISLGGL